ncbi:MAG TPA: hypothetical protein VKJ65_07490, partial [Phycisphaerae bacterium]|nr:hypothetical protein [Phycisphaerae bacterium]
MRNGVSLRKNRLGNFFKHNFNAQSKRAAILAAATAWIAPLKRSPILAAVQAALSTPSRRSAVMIAAAATAMVVASASNITPVRGDVTQNYIGPNGGYWGTASYWSNNVVPNNTGTTYIVDTSTGTSGDSTVDLHGGSFTIGGIFGNGSYISAITNTEGVGELIIDPSTLTSPIGSVIKSTIESGTAGNPFVLQIGDNNGSDTSIVTELNPTTGTIGGGTAATDNVKIVLDGVEGNADFVQNNHYSGGTVIENGATAIAEVAGSFGTGQITFQTN